LLLLLELLQVKLWRLMLLLEGNYVSEHRDFVCRLHLLLRFLDDGFEVLRFFGDYVGLVPELCCEVLHFNSSCRVTCRAKEVLVLNETRLTVFLVTELLDQLGMVRAQLHAFTLLPRCPVLRLLENLL